MVDEAIPSRVVTTLTRDVTRVMPLVTATALALAVFVPLVGPGVVLLLDYGDYPVGPNPALPGSVWGFPPGLTSRAPVNAVLVATFTVFPWSIVRLVPWLAVPFLIVWGFRRIFPESPLRFVGASLLYFVNPFVYERILAGQVYLVLGYALLPLLLALLLERGSLASALVGGILLDITVALAPHYVFIAGLLLAGCLAAAILRRDVRGIARLLVTSAAAGIGAIYWLLPAWQLRTRLDELTTADLSIFQSMPDAHLGLLPNLAGLYGFWREGWPLPKDSLPGWFLFLAAMLAVIARGYGSGFRDRASRRVAGFLLMLGMLGLCLALGDVGLTGAGFAWMFEHVQAARIMREPQKFLALLVLAYAWGFGMGLEAIARTARSSAGKVLIVVLLLVVPGVYTFRMFWGFNGYVQPSRYPASWAEANSAMGDGPGRVLALPWHLYLPLSWTQGRIVSNPMASYFGRETIVGDNAEVAGLEMQSRTARSRYLEFLFSAGQQTRSFGNLVAPLDIRYILLQKVADWQAFAWLWQQSDLRLVREWPDLALFENLTPAARLYSPAGRIEVQDWGELVGVAEKERLVDHAIRVGHARPGPVRASSEQVIRGSSMPVSPSASSPVRYDVRAAHAGATVVLAEPFDGQWTSSHGRVDANMGVTNLATLGEARDGSLRYGRWPLIRAAYAISGIGVLLLLAVAVFIKRRGRNASTAMERAD
jgi:hypothetical protein